MNGKGLAEDGTIAREGSLDRVPETFAPVVADARSRIAEAFGGERLHSAYLYGSVPRGSAVPGRSDLDLLLALRGEPTDADRGDADGVAAALDTDHPAIDTAGILLVRARTALSELERHDLGFFVACLCTPLLGPDLASALPRYRPTSLLARETNGDLALALPRWRASATAEDLADADRTRLCRRVARRLVRTGFTLVMPRWGGWTSDLEESADVFGRYYPGRAARMRSAAAAAARTASPDPGLLRLFLDDLGPWLAAEYTAVHGKKAPRP
ncbi:nucleotidyltransferase [Streptomyces sp. WZ.A104]|uniref:nucleotidyltransferase domain-containing protein n=1 Tax=Streptomyces sp. WZ.A104 TaxID=2023771 RepID=UPI000BBCE36A|nr:nucleotidyltransferase domain-containing protein [Streptomyces sp. WZ.A104]PCG85757.1 nucleotidyltransferase [Streptomyces sp. WZ.A104]